MAAQIDGTTIPIIDFSKYNTDFNALVGEVKKVSETWGFLYLKNHELDQSKIDRIFEISDFFFKHATAEEKNSCPWSSIYNAGYDDQTETPGYFKEYGANERTSSRDGKEYFSFRKPNSYDQPLPPTLQKVKPEVQDFIRQTHEKIAIPVLSCLSAALGLKKDHLPKMHNFDSPSVASLRLIHYPALLEGDDAPIRLGSHTDHGVITVLFQHLVRGLQIRPPKYSGPVKEDEVWIDAPIIPGAVLINIGETMTFFSGGTMKSTLHRVARSPSPEEKDKERFSTVYFCHANQDTLLEVLDGINQGVKREPPISCVTGLPVKTVKDWIEHRHSMGRVLVK